MFEQDTYDNLTSKMYTTIRHIYKYRALYDWYLKADTDTFIFFDNLRTFLSTKDPNLPVTFGYDFKTLVKNGFVSYFFLRS